jgi:hypothetical protein
MMLLLRGKRREAGAPPPAEAPPPPAPPSPPSRESDASPISLAPPPPFPAAMPEPLARATSVEDAASPTSVYRFDVGKYRDGSFRFVPASATDFVRYTGRVLHHGPTPARKTKVNTVQFDWSAVAFELRVTGARTVGIRLKGDGAFILCVHSPLPAPPRPRARRRHHDGGGTCRCHALNTFRPPKLTSITKKVARHFFGGRANGAANRPACLPEYHEGCSRTDRRVYVHVCGVQATTSTCS